MFCPTIGLWTYGEDTNLDKSGSTSGCGKNSFLNYRKKRTEYSKL